MNIAQISNNIHYIGVTDLHSDLFESLWTLPKGVTYNSYIVTGEKIALIDTVPLSDARRYIDNIKGIIGDVTPDYLIVNHMEPDHSGAIDYIRNVYPDIKILCMQAAVDMLKRFNNIATGVTTVTDGEILDLGNDIKLKFVQTPMLHWPETMMTYEISSGTLFSGDAFGSFGALNGAIFDGETEIEEFIPEIYRYYASIVAKYGTFVQRALVKLKGASLNMICTTHGPVWKDYLMHILDLYDRMSRYESEKGVVIAYSSMYGNTAEIAQIIARVLLLKGITVKVHNLSKSNLSEVLADAIRYKGIIIGAPNYNNSIFPPAKSFVDAIVARGFKNRVISTFGTYAWSKGIGSTIQSQLSELPDVKIVDSSLDMKGSDIESIESCVEDYVDKIIAEL